MKTLARCAKILARCVGYVICWLGVIFVIAWLLLALLGWGDVNGWW